MAWMERVEVVEVELPVVLSFLIRMNHGIIMIHMEEVAAVVPVADMVVKGHMGGWRAAHRSVCFS